VAHRLRTIYDSDQILVLKDGHVAEKGSHRELLDQNGIYAELWNGKNTTSFTLIPWEMTDELISFFLFSLLTAQELSMSQDLEYERSLDGEGATEEVDEPKSK
jgi:ABC transporter ATM